MRSIYAASSRDLIRTQRIVQHASPLTTARYLEAQSELADLVLGLGRVADPITTILAALPLAS
ncbi:hypothetical protein [Oleiharenicola lentus]|uniref:hypothetical protein n=1 Tax=Oleiharenicola lentus TaxID=2508720 RepID=UPI003F67B373